MSSLKKVENDKMKSSTILCSGLIQCNEENYNPKFYSLMKDGYIEMGKINLQLASDNEGELVEINNYEMWLCGV